MSDVAAAPATTTTSPAMKKATKPKGEKKARTAPTHPVYGTMIKSAIKELKDRKGASKQAILKFIVQKYKVGDNEKQINARLRLALKRGVQSGLLTQASGTGAAGRFRLAEKSSHEATTKVPRKPKVKSKAKPKERVAASPVSYLGVREMFLLGSWVISARFVVPSKFVSGSLSPKVTILYVNSRFTFALNSFPENKTSIF
uniref:H15 domain-containing protein n=1 Tax=Angiostrongylus cantonensis TaxID=6313 RepID=A0A0K0D3M5_ANGCA